MALWREAAKATEAYLLCVFNCLHCALYSLKGLIGLGPLTFDTTSSTVKYIMPPFVLHKRLTYTRQREGYKQSHLLK